MRDKHSSKTILLTIIALLIVLAGATSAVIVLRAPGKQPAKPATSSTTVHSQTAAQPTSTSNVTYDGVSGKTALQLLQTRAQVVTKDSSYGPYVDSINGVKGGTGGKYWTFYVNGKQAQVGAGAYVTQAGDKIEWKFE